MTSAMIGSRPVVGSSKKMISGSAAMARARPTRFCMPPDSSAGERFATSAPSPTLASFSSAISRASRARDAAALDQAEGDVLPDRQAVEQRAALEQHAEFRAAALRACAPLIWVTSSPSTRIVPASGRMMPSTHLIVTDLPVPEPPMMTSEFAFVDDEIDAVEHDLGPEALLDPAKFDLGLSGHGSQRLKNTEVSR